jgi:CSLREA domain-containing protein
MTRLGRAPCISSTQLSPGRRLCRLIHLLAPVVVPAIVVTALGCGKDAESPTSPAEPGGPDFSHTVGHKVVNSLADPGNGTCNAIQCTLREAIKDPQSTEISFAPGLTGTITLARSGLGGGTLVIEKTLTITGPSTGIVIQRRSTDPEFRILRIGLGGIVTLTNLTLRNGKTDGQVGGIINFGTLALTTCTVANNSGGGISNHGRLTLTNSRVVNNSGNGIFNSDDRTLTLTNVAIADNLGIGIWNRGGTLEFTNGAVTGNSLRGIVSSYGPATITRVRIVGTGGGGISNAAGRLTLTNSTVARNSAGEGGGIFNGRAGKTTIENSTISNNSATGVGGGVRNRSGDPFGRVGGSVSLTNSTVSGNSAGSGGGIDNTDSKGGVVFVVVNSTIAFNSARDSGGGIRQAGGGVVQETFVALRNTIVAKNSAPTGPDVLADSPAEFGGFVGASFSLIGDGTGSRQTNTAGNQVGNVPPNSSPIDPKLGPLTDNGGPTRTHALLLGSPAIDAASTPDCPTTDQRRVLRPQGAACDIGSYERK